MLIQMDAKLIDRPIQSEIAILKQPSAELTSSGFIDSQVRDNELRQIEVMGNQILEEQSKLNKSIRYQTLQEILTNTSDACIGVITDIVNKPKDTDWKEYIPKVVTKDYRHTYLGILLIFVSVYLYMIRL